MPAVSKWTKLAPCLHMVVFGMLTHDSLSKCLQALRDKTAIKLAAGGGDTEQDYLRDADWSAVQGKRFKSAMELFEDPKRREALLVLCLVLEGQQMLVQWYMKLAKEKSDPCRAPEVLEALDPRRSIVFAVRQYLGAMVKGLAPRLRLLWQPAGAFAKWCATNPDGVRCLRRALLLLDCSIYRKHQKPLDNWTWQLLRLCDHCTTQADHAKIRNNFFQVLPCCLQPGFVQHVHAATSRPDDLMEEKWMVRLQMLARLLTMQTADVEWRHARNHWKAGASGSTLGQMACRSLAAEALVVDDISRSEQELLCRRHSQTPARGPRQSVRSLAPDGALAEVDKCIKCAMPVLPPPRLALHRPPGGRTQPGERACRPLASNCSSWGMVKTQCPVRRLWVEVLL